MFLFKPVLSEIARWTKLILHHFNIRIYIFRLSVKSIFFLDYMKNNMFRILLDISKSIRSMLFYIIVKYLDCTYVIDVEIYDRLVYRFFWLIRENPCTYAVPFSISIFFLHAVSRREKEGIWCEVLHTLPYFKKREFFEEWQNCVWARRVIKF